MPIVVALITGSDSTLFTDVLENLQALPSGELVKLRHVQDGSFSKVDSAHVSFDETGSYPHRSTVGTPFLPNTTPKANLAQELVKLSAVPDCFLNYRHLCFQTYPYQHTKEFQSALIQASQVNHACSMSLFPSALLAEFRELTRCPDARPLALGQTASDVLSLIPDVVYETFGEAKGVLVLDGCYGGGRGQFRFVCPNKIEPPHGKELYADSSHIHRIESPWIQAEDLKKVLQMSSVELLPHEARCLSKVRRLFKHHDVSAVILEVIRNDLTQALSGTFLRALSHMARQYGALLFVDEVLMGLVTGKPFAWQWVRDFRPDVVVVGKSFGVNAMFAVGTDVEVESPCMPNLVTSEVRLVSLVEPLFRWRYIRQRSLMTRAARMASTLRKDLRRRGIETAGIGANISCTEAAAAASLNAFTRHGRIFLPLDVDKAFVRRILQDSLIPHDSPEQIS